MPTNEQSIDDEKSTIHAAMERFSSASCEACQGSGTMLAFLNTADLPPYYQIKANIVLSACDEENEPWENEDACKHFLRKAEEALATAKQTYVHDPEDAKQLTVLEEAIQEEWAAIRQRKIDAKALGDEIAEYYGHY